MEIEYLDLPIEGVVAGYSVRSAGELPPSDDRNFAQETSDYENAIGIQRHAWLRQVHKNLVVRANTDVSAIADGHWTDQKVLCLNIASADCLPVLLWSRKGDFVAAGHCGWRGLATGILESLVTVIPSHRADCEVAIGPAICQDCYEVGEEVLEAVAVSRNDNTVKPSFRRYKYFFDLPRAAANRLRSLGVASVALPPACTRCDPRFYSYRRDGQTGRTMSFIYLA